LGRRRSLSSKELLAGHHHVAITSDPEKKKKKKKKKKEKERKKQKNQKKEGIPVEKVGGQNGKGKQTKSSIRPLTDVSVRRGAQEETCEEGGLSRKINLSKPSVRRGNLHTDESTSITRERGAGVSAAKGGH